MAELIIQSDEGIAELRTRCELLRDSLAELISIHLEVDDHTRIMEGDEPHWIGRLRKICLHARAINGWEIGVNVEHVLAPEIRAAFEQMSVVWKSLPPSLKLEAVDGDRWAKEARSGLLATLDHPTPQTLMLSSEQGGFSNNESGVVYARLALWLGRLVFGYSLALVHLSQVLGSRENIESCVTSILHKSPLGYNPL